MRMTIILTLKYIQNQHRPLSFAYHSSLNTRDLASCTKGIIASSFLRLCSSLKKPVRVPGSVPCANYGIICFYIFKNYFKFFFNFKLIFFNILYFKKQSQPYSKIIILAKSVFCLASAHSTVLTASSHHSVLQTPLSSLLPIQIQDLTFEQIGQLE